MSAIALPKIKEDAGRPELLEYARDYERVTNEWLKRQIIEYDRIDILATEFLGYGVEPFHLSMMRYQILHPDNLQMVFRGAGKTTICTVTKTIHLLLKNPNLRILIASKTAQNAEGFLREVKNHFESNERLKEVFGAYYDARADRKWDNREIEVLPRKSNAKEASVTCVGVEGTIVSKHYDVIISDDLVDEENARTKHQRDKTRTWYYQTLDPTLEPPDPEVPHRGEHHRQGTRYHYDDLWGHLIANELKDHHQVIRALDPKGRSPWPAKFPPEFFLGKRRKSGIIIFNAQYQNDTEAMKGEIFQYDDCQRIDHDAIPKKDSLRIYMGVDLAISEKEGADKFAIVVIGVTPGHTAIYILDWFEDQLRFGAQSDKIVEYVRRWDPIRTGIENNQYQDAQLQNLRDREENPDEDNDTPQLRLKPIRTIKDKITRAWKLSPYFEDKKVYFQKNTQDLLVEALVLFPNAGKDLFDALDNAVQVSKMKSRKKRKNEPGLL